MTEPADSPNSDSRDAIEVLKEAFCEQNAGRFRDVLARHPELTANINEPLASFDAPLITSVRSREMLDVLLDAGADINAKSRWWAGGFGVLHGAAPDLAAYAIQHGAIVDVHAAARLGMIERLRELVREDPQLVKARGGDGQTPLHFASTIEIAEFLLEHGAEINARDIDHESTPAQHMIRDRQEIARHLVKRGCDTDILLAAALGDLDLVRRHLDADPNCIHVRVTGEYFPMINPKSGGTIYQWTLGWYVSPHEVAKQFGHERVYELLMERSPADAKLVAACWANDRKAITTLLSERPGVVESLSAEYRRHVAHAARNNNLDAVRVMLEIGFPVDARGQHSGSALHWAAFHGNDAMVRDILRHNPPIEARDADFNSTPIGWAIHGSENGWHKRTGNYAATVQALLQAGATVPSGSASGSDSVKDALRRHSSRS